MIRSTNESIHSVYTYFETGHLITQFGDPVIVLLFQNVRIGIVVSSTASSTSLQVAAVSSRTTSTVHGIVVVSGIVVAAAATVGVLALVHGRNLIAKISRVCVLVVAVVSVNSSLLRWPVFFDQEKRNTTI